MYVKKGYPVGEKNGNAKLTNHDVELMRVLREGGMSASEIARKFEVTDVHVRRVCAYKDRCYG